MAQRGCSLSPRELVATLKRRARRSRPEWHEVKAGPLQGQFLYLDQHGSPAWSEMIDGAYDQFIYDALRHYGDLQGKTIWDVGAHFGYHSLAFASLVGASGQVIAFEPNPCNVERLEKNIVRNEKLGKRIALMACALADSDGEAAFSLSENVDNGSSSGSHLAHALTPEIKEHYWSFAARKVPTARADTLVAQGKVAPPQVMKIDVEGAESMVLLGSHEVLRQYHPIIVAEIHNVLMMYHVQKLLTALQYDLIVLDEQHALPSRCFVLAFYSPK
ncbi:MAG: hypothetical protein COZ12_01310 [Deltaproteobacteria bacterium CG_4_10_14_3_um_filter_60_8]|nr:MAG: hypothetical protein COZ12_01310 [Deltaproteobacteria bacterium CG_4_10_14_3_um_filter_60_8]